MNFGDITLARSPQLRTTAAVHVPALRVILEKFLETTGGHDGTPSQRGLFQGSGRALDCLWCKENRIGFGRPVLHPKRSALPISKTVTKIVTRLCPNIPQSDQKAARPEIPALNPPRTRLLPPKLHKTVIRRPGTSEPRPYTCGTPFKTSMLFNNTQRLRAFGRRAGRFSRPSSAQRIGEPAASTLTPSRR